MRVRSFHWSARLLGSEGLRDAQEMLGYGYYPPSNIISKREYNISPSLVNSYRQQIRGGTGFRDIAIIKLRSGDGGNGKISFLRESGRAVGPPDGGDGGEGGRIYVQAQNNISGLGHLRHIYTAANGKSGGSTQLSGKNGTNVVLQVPVGTSIYWSPSLDDLKSGNLTTTVDTVQNISIGNASLDTAIQLHRECHKENWLFKEKDEDYWRQQPTFKRLASRVQQLDIISRRTERERDIFPFQGLDLSTPSDPIQLLGGGMGGLGNMHFQTPELRSPRFATKGRAGIEGTFIFELKMLADVGLVGLPNAGKSTLLRAISAAKPQVGHWEFTTLAPSIGTISLGLGGPQFTVADIPGIIDGASKNRGLGLGFLRHIERSRGITFVIALDRADPRGDLEILISELGTRMKDKKCLVVATKADLPGTETAYNNLKSSLPVGFDIIPCSAQEGGNVDAVIERMGAIAGVE